MIAKIKHFLFRRNGSVLVLLAVALVILATLGGGLLTVAYGVRHRAIRLKSEAVAMLVAEAGYEKAIHWMCQQPDMLSALYAGVSGTRGEISVSGGHCDYSIGIHTFVRHRPIYRIVSNGHSGVFTRTVDVYVIQAISGWTMGMCRVPSGSTSTYPVNFASGELIDMPIHINELGDNPDKRDIYISGDPIFLQRVVMGESRYSSWDDKYAGVMDLFKGSILFDQPDCWITDEDAVALKINRFRDSTKMNYRFTPKGTAPVSNPHNTVQLEFFEEGGEGKIRITNNCTVRGYHRNTTWDWKIKPGSDSKEFERYDIYAYHYANEDEPIIEVKLKDTYVTQSYGEYHSEPGGQIYVDGDVVIGSKDYDAMVVRGKMTVAASGNIWIADSIVVSDFDNAGNHYPRSDGMPGEDNPNVLGLIAQGVIKVADPGMTDDDYGSVGFKPGVLENFEYVPIALPDNPDAVPGDDDYHKRHLTDPTMVEAAIVVGGGGWGAENVARPSGWWGGTHGGRKEWPGSGEDPYQDELVVRGVLVECCRGVVGLIGKDGYLKHYYFDERVLEGILPGDIWLEGKYIPAPAGWHDYRR
jgi:hypothetical protein